VRKFTGLFIAAAVAGTVWWQLPNVTGKSLIAQTGRSSYRSSSAYEDTARHLMQQAQTQARQGNLASAKRLTLQASRFSVKWAANELTPTQLLSDLNKRSTQPPRQLNLAAVAGRQLASPAQPKPSNELITRAVGRTNTTSNPTIARTGFFDSGQPRAVAGSTEKISPLRGRVNEHMARARAAWQKGDRYGAIRQASVTRLLADDVKFQPGEETPEAFLNRVRSSGVPAGNVVVSGVEDETGPVFIETVPESRTQPTDSSNPFAEPTANPVVPELTGPSRQQVLESAGDRKQYADSLLSAAKEDLRSRRLESAYEKALLASQADTVRSLFDETSEQVLSTIRRHQQQSPSPIETLIQSGDSGQPKAPASPFSYPTDFSATPGRATASAAAPDRVLEILDQPQSAPTGQTTNISDDELAKQLLAECRQLMRDGRFDDARAAAIRAKNLDVTFDVFSDTPQVVLRDIDFISGTITLAESSQAKLDTLPDISPFQAPADPTTAALVSQNEKHAKTQELPGSAKQLVEETHDLNAAYQLFDERPETVMADIERLRIQFTPPNRTRNAVTIPFQGSFEEMPPFEADPEELPEAYEELQLTPVNDDSQSAEAVSHWSSPITEETEVESFNPSLIRPATNGHKTRESLLPGTSARSVGVWLKNNTPELRDQERVVEANQFEESFTAAYEELQLTLADDDSQPVELVTHWDPPVTKVTPAELPNPSHMQPATNTHETRNSLLPLPSARGVETWLTNDAPLELPTVSSNSAPLLP
jgi:hypothetical protein